MKCVICKHGQTELGATTVTLERDELMLVVKKVPAQVCANCSEAYVSEQVAERLLHIIDEIASGGAQVDIRQYMAA